MTRFSILLLLALSGCGGGDGAGGGAGGTLFSAPLPPPVSGSGLTVAAQLSIDRDAPTPLTVDPVLAQVRGAVAVAAGNRSLTLSLRVTRGNDVVEVAQANRVVDIAPNQISLTPFVTEDFRYPDLDGDGFTNLAELVHGTDPSQFASRPMAEGLRASGSYVLRDRVAEGPETLLSVTTEPAASNQYNIY